MKISRSIATVFIWSDSSSTQFGDTLPLIVPFLSLMANTLVSSATKVILIFRMLLSKRHTLNLSVDMMFLRKFNLGNTISEISPALLSEDTLRKYNFIQWSSRPEEHRFQSSFLRTSCSSCSHWKDRCSWHQPSLFLFSDQLFQQGNRTQKQLGYSWRKIKS